MLKRAQVAVEFLMNYGWAILAVLVVLAALAYFGVLSPTMFVPERCSFPAPFSCLAASAGDDGVSVMLQNNAGRDAIVKGISFSSDALAGDCAATGIDAVLKDGESAVFYANDPLACSFVKTGSGKDKYDAAITYSWTDANLDNKLVGEAVAARGGTFSQGALYGGGGSGMAGYWKFDTSGQAEDSSGNGNDGTVNGATWQGTSCISGGCYSFDGVNDYVNLDEQKLPKTATEGTIAFWAFLTETGDYQEAFSIDQSSMPDATTRSSLGIELSGDSSRSTYVTLRQDGPAALWRFHATTNIDYTAGWRHVALRHDGTEASFFINGVSVPITWDVTTDKTAWFKAILTDATNPADNFQIGIGEHSPSTFHYPLNGYIDEVFIYNRALTPGEIAALAGK